MRKDKCINCGRWFDPIYTSTLCCMKCEGEFLYSLEGDEVAVGQYRYLKWLMSKPFGQVHCSVEDLTDPREFVRERAYKDFKYKKFIGDI